MTKHTQPLKLMGLIVPKATYFVALITPLPNVLNQTTKQLALFQGHLWLHSSVLVQILSSD
jgi:hypothetical protein